MNLKTSSRATQDRRYLAQLAKELASVPKKYRTEVLDGIRTHISDALERGDVGVAAILDQLGTPSVVAAQAMHDLDEESGRFAHPTSSTRGRKLQVWSFAVALLVVLLGGFFSAQPSLTVPILLSALPPLALTLVPLLTRGPRWLLVSAICATALTAFLVTAGVLSVAMNSFAFPLTLFLIPTQTMAVFYLPMLVLAIIPLFLRRP